VRPPQVATGMGTVMRLAAGDMKKKVLVLPMPAVAGSHGATAQSRAAGTFIIIKRPVRLQI